MKKSKVFIKLTAILTATVLMCSVMTGCNSKQTDKDDQGRTVFTVANWPDKEGEELDRMNDRKARYEEANPDAVVQGDLWKWERDSFYAKAAGGRLPNLYMVGFTEMPEIINSEYSAELTGVLKKRGYEGKFNEDVLDIVSKDGKIFAFPRRAYVLGLGYNTELFEAAGLMEADGTPKQPKTWDEVVEFAVKIKEATGKPGFLFPSKGNYGGWMFSCLAWSFGVDFMKKAEDEKWKATFATKEAEEALQYIKDLKWKYDVVPANTLIDGTEYFRVFATGNAGMFICAGDMPSSVSAYGMKPEQIGMMALPAGPKRHVTLLGGGVFCMNKEATEDQIDAAIRWVEMEYNYKLSDEFKKNKEEVIKQTLENGQLVGIKSMSVWSESSEALKFENELIDKNANANPNHVRLYNEFVADCPAEIQPEEPVCCQELYAILDSCVQEVLVNKDADCAELLKKAASDFQANYLDNLTY